MLLAARSAAIRGSPEQRQLLSKSPLQLLDIHSNVAPESGINLVMSLLWASDVVEGGVLPELEIEHFTATTDEQGTVNFGRVAIRPGTGRAPSGETVMKCRLVICGQADQADQFEG